MQLFSQRFRAAGYTVLALSGILPPAPLLAQQAEVKKETVRCTVQFSPVEEHLTAMRGTNPNIPANLGPLVFRLTCTDVATGEITVVSSLASTNAEVSLPRSRVKLHIQPLFPGKAAESGPPSPGCAILDANLYMMPSYVSPEVDLSHEKAETRGPSALRVILTPATSRP
jgi:hypothetical protein